MVVPWILADVDVRRQAPAGTPLNRSTSHSKAVPAWENIGMAWFMAVYGIISGSGSVTKSTVPPSPR